MKISVSNIAWKNDNIEKFFELLSTEKCQGVEIAPSKIWSDLSEIHEKDIINFKTLLQDYKLELVGFHSLLYNLNDLQLFKDKESRTKTKKYLFRLIDLCSSLGGKQLIFGSPNLFSKSTFIVKPELGDFYLFPNYLMHTVYPFTGTDQERRSVSFNAQVQFSN